MTEKKNIKILFILFSILLVLPSICYLIRNGTILGFTTYYNFFINDGSYKIASTILYLVIFILLTAIYVYFVRKEDSFKDIKQLLIYCGIIGMIFVVMLPWTSSDIFYYMGVGELNSVYGQNPYYVTIRDYCNENKENLQNDTIMKQGYRNVWSGTTVVYGPVAQIIFSGITKLSFKNINICIILFKLVNLIIHLLNCYFMYKITKKLKFSILYGLNPFVFLEFIGMVHNDIIVVFLVLVATYFLLKKKKLLLSVLFLALATGIKYFTVMLLPIFILYHFKDEKSLYKRILRCLEYGIIFMVTILLEYAVYYRDTSIFTAMMVQNEKFSKSIYSRVMGLGKLKQVETINLFGKMFAIREVCKKTRKIIFGIFAIIYIKFCIDLLTTKNIKFSKTLRKYNSSLLLFFLCLGTFQQWYLVWLFATMPWQKSNTIRGIICLSIASELADSIYMFKRESYVYDMHFLVIMLGIWAILIICELDLKKKLLLKKKTNLNKIV